MSDISTTITFKGPIPTDERIMRYQKILESYATPKDNFLKKDALVAGTDNLYKKLTDALPFMSPLEYRFMNSFALAMSFELTTTEQVMKSRAIEEGVREKDWADVFDMLKNTSFIDHQGLARVYALKAISIEDDTVVSSDLKKDDRYILLKKPLYVNFPILRNLVSN